MKKLIYSMKDKTSYPLPLEGKREGESKRENLTSILTNKSK